MEPKFNAKEVINDIWQRIIVGTELMTPDNLAGRSFSITAVGPESVSIRTQAGSPLVIRKESFVEALDYLLNNNHWQENPCNISSNQSASRSGPLCLATRNVNGNTRVINYIVPVLVSLGFLGVCGRRPNKTWLIEG